MSRHHIGEVRRRHPAALEMFVAQDNAGRSGEDAAIGGDAHEALRQNLEQMIVEQLAGIDRKAGLLTHFADQRRATILARVGPSPG